MAGWLTGRRAGCQRRAQVGAPRRASGRRRTGLRSRGQSSPL